MGRYLLFDGFKADRGYRRGIISRMWRRWKWRRKSLKWVRVTAKSGGMIDGRTGLPLVTEQVKVVRETKKALLLRNSGGKTAWFPKAWFTDRRKNPDGFWQVTIRADRWKAKFPSAFNVTKNA